MHNGELPISASEVARRFSVDAATVRRWIASGRLPAFRTPGGTYRIHPEDVEKFLQPITINEDIVNAAAMQSIGPFP